MFARLAVLLAVTVLALTGLATSAHAETPAGYHEHAGPHGERDVNVCRDDVGPGVAHCLARVRTRPASDGGPHVSYGPAELQDAYNAPSATNGIGATVAIVDAYDNPNAESDLATYRSTFGLPPCTTANGCFRKVDQNGGTNYPAHNAGWALESSLDVDMVSAICPNCHIVLVESNSNSTASLGEAENTAAALNPVAISNSWGASDSTTSSQYDHYFNHPGIAITVSSGDSGAHAEYPAASPYVVAVGGTALRASATDPRGWTETAWTGAGSGCSRAEAKTSWQHDTGCARRTIADVSAVADPVTGVEVYDSDHGGLLAVGGTSASSPIIAAFYGLAGGFTGAPASLPYLHAGALNDVTAGSNGSCGGTYLCNAVAGYDGPTGNGTPNGVSAFTGAGAPNPPPPASGDFTVKVTPTRRIPHGHSGVVTVTVTRVNGLTTPIALSTSGLGPNDTATFSPSPITGSKKQSRLTIKLSALDAPGTFTLHVIATVGALSHTADTKITIT